MTVILLVLLLVTGFHLTGCEASPKTEITVNKNVQWWEAQFHDHLKSLTLKDGKAVFVFDGFLGRTAQAVTLGVGEELEDIDHHGTQKIIIRSIDADGVLVDYESRFDHRSFGKNLVTVDSGSLKLNWKQ